MDALFTLVRQLAFRQRVTEVAAPKWLVQRHALGALAAHAGASAYREELARAAIEWARIEADLPGVVSAFATAGIRVAPIKGVAYAKSLYGSPAERPMSDIDLLVHPTQVESARRVLERLHFTPARAALLHHAEPWTSADIVIDLHWNIIAPGRCRIDLDAIWSRVRPGWPTGAEVLETNDALVFHLVHLVRNRLCLPLVNVVDAARLLESADADTVLVRARSWGLGRAVQVALQFCRDVLADRSPPGGWLGPTRAEIANLTKRGVARKVVFDIAMSGGARQIVSRVAHFGANALRERMLNNR